MAFTPHTVRVKVDASTVAPELPLEVWQRAVQNTTGNTKLLAVEQLPNGTVELTVELTLAVTYQ